jgi:hypothetical protein
MSSFALRKLGARQARVAQQMASQISQRYTDGAVRCAVHAQVDTTFLPLPLNPPPHPITSPSKVCLQKPSQAFYAYFFCNEPNPGRISTSCTISTTSFCDMNYFSTDKSTCPFQQDMILVDEKSFSPNAMRVADEIVKLNMIEVAGRI